ncbi:MAG: type I-E CRISPR-associated protein Cse1/CasA [Pseudonocardia sp.]
MSTADQYDLRHEPWLPCREPDGTVTELGVLPALSRAHHLTGLIGDLPTQTFALTRLLLAVLHGALRGPRDRAEWKQLWTAPTLPVDRIAEYLDRHRHRFHLFHPETPFLQAAGLHTAKGDTSELSKLIADVPNGLPFFATRRGELSLTHAEAARWVVHCNAFDPSGIKTGAVGDPRNKGGRGYPIGVAWSGWLGGLLLEGDTLKETLLLNLVAADFAACPRDPDLDLPVWERPPLAAEDESGHVDQGREPTGPVDLYTWPSRRIRLFTEGGRVTRVLVANGNRLSRQNRHLVEPHTAWRRSPTQEKKASSPVYMPRPHNPDRAIWRGLESLLPAVSSRQSGSGAKGLAPGIVEWLGHLSTGRAIPREHLVRFRAAGVVYGSNASVVDDVVHDTLNLRAGLAEQGAVAQAEFVRACVQAAEDAALALANLAGDLVAAAGGIGDGPRSRARERLYARLDPEFREWLRSVGSDSDTDELRRDWHRRAQRVTQDAADDLLANISPACWVGREVRGRPMTAAHAENRFRISLRTALPAAYETVSA